jgi:Cu/Ag efflux pump CusA
MWSTGLGPEVMQRTAAPMIGGMITAPLLLLLIVLGRPVFLDVVTSRDCRDEIVRDAGVSVV